jgi:membrane fusion protein (multidrug efflux system)
MILPSLYIHKRLSGRFMKIQFAPSVCFALVALSFNSCGGEESKPAAPAAREVSVAAVERRDVPIVMEFTGQTKGAVDAEVRARVDGIIQEIHFAEGKEVKEGQLLYSIDPAPLRAKVAEAKAGVAAAQTQLDKAESDLKRAKPLAAMKAISARDLDAAVAAEGTARSAVDAAKASLDAAELELGYASVTAPISGVIGLTKAKVGEYVGKAPNPVVLNTISQLDPIHVRVPVSEKDFLFFARQRQAAQDAGLERKKAALELVLADGAAYPKHGQVESKDRQIDPQTGSLMIEASFPNPDKFLVPGQFAKIRVIAETRHGALVVPKQALRELQGQYQVVVVKSDNTVETRTVQAGPTVGNLQIVESGVSENEQVATEGLQWLKSGLLVTPKVTKVAG